MPSVAEEPRYITGHEFSRRSCSSPCRNWFLFFAEEDAAQTMSISDHHYGVCDAGHDGSPLLGS